MSRPTIDGRHDCPRCGRPLRVGRDGELQDAKPTCDVGGRVTWRIHDCAEPDPRPMLKVAEEDW